MPRLRSQFLTGGRKLSQVDRHQDVEKILPAFQQAGSVGLAQFKLEIRRADDPQGIYQKLRIETDTDRLSFVIDRRLDLRIAGLRRSAGKPYFVLFQRDLNSFRLFVGQQRRPANRTERSLGR